MRDASVSRPKSFGLESKEFRDRQARALQRRLAMTGLTMKQIAYATGVHADTIMNWSYGRTTMNGAALMAIDEFFCALGDWTFFEEIYGGLATRRRFHADQLERQARQLRETAAAIDRGAA